MAKLNYYTQYCYEDDYNDDYNTDCDQLKWAFEILSELNILPGRESYKEYNKIKNTEKMYRERMLNKVGFGDNKGNFYRVG